VDPSASRRCPRCGLRLVRFRGRWECPRGHHWETPPVAGKR
jgi:transposase